MATPATRRKLNDPPRSTFDPGYHAEIHAVVLIGDATDKAMTARRNEILGLLPDSVTVLAEETGLGRVNARGEGIEHFGYVDGRSQPLFLTEDADAEKNNTDGINVWNPAAPLSQVLVPDTAAPDPGVHFGSYFVFRKLEQNVRRFKQAEADLADTLGLTGDDRERAGAMLIGRFEDGTPLTTQREDGAESPVSNNFTYDSDRAALKCPFQAHIRKTNPRGSGGAEDPSAERLHLMARRGVTYGERPDDPNAEVPPSARPSGGVGLLFMAFNAVLGNQFEFTQALWADNPGFPITEGVTPGLDPVIGQGERGTSEYTVEWGGSTQRTAEPVPQAVTLRGGSTSSCRRWRSCGHSDRSRRRRASSKAVNATFRDKKSLDVAFTAWRQISPSASPAPAAPRPGGLPRRPVLRFATPASSGMSNAPPASRGPAPVRSPPP